MNQMKQKKERSIVTRLFYRKFHIIKELDKAGNVVRPAGICWQPRFSWVGPIKGWRDDEIMRELSGRLIWGWGLMICNDLGVYVTFNHWLKWELKAVWCLLCHAGQHDRGGMFDSCSRCGK